MSPRQRLVAVLVISAAVIGVGLVLAYSFVVMSARPVMSHDETARWALARAGGSVEGTLRQIEQDKNDGPLVLNGMFALVYLCDTDRSSADHAAAALAGVIERMQGRQFLLDECYAYMAERADRSHNPLLLELLKHRPAAPAPDEPLTSG